MKRSATANAKARLAGGLSGAGPQRNSSPRGPRARRPSVCLAWNLSSLTPSPRFSLLARLPSPIYIFSSLSLNVSLSHFTVLNKRSAARTSEPPHLPPPHIRLSSTTLPTHSDHHRTAPLPSPSRARFSSSHLSPLTTARAAAPAPCPPRSPPCSVAPRPACPCRAVTRCRAATRDAAPRRPPPRTKWTRRVLHPVLIGHAASLTPY